MKITGTFLCLFFATSSFGQTIDTAELFNCHSLTFMDVYKDSVIVEYCADFSGKQIIWADTCFLITNESTGSVLTRGFSFFPKNKIMFVIVSLMDRRYSIVIPLSKDDSKKHLYLYKTGNQFELRREEKMLLLE